MFTVFYYFRMYFIGLGTHTDAYGRIRMHTDVYGSITDVYKHLYNPLYAFVLKNTTFTGSPAKMAITIRTVPKFCAQ